MTVGTRRWHPDLEARVMASFASVGPLPEPARAAMADAAALQARVGVAAVARLVEVIEGVRTGLTAVLDAPGAGVALLGNTTDGVLAVAHGLNWRPGERILLFEGEFPTNTTPWQVAANLYDLRVDWLPVDVLATDDGLQRVEEVLRRGVRLVAISAVQFRDGMRAPLQALANLAHAHDAQLFVDAIQAVGGVPLRLGAIDWLATGGQKWLLGPLGTGALIAPADNWAMLHPRQAGWLSHVDPLAFLLHGPGELVYDRPLRDDPARVEGGARNLVGHAGLAASLEILREVGVQAIFDHAQSWLDAVEPALLEIGFASTRNPDPTRRSNILSVVPPQGHTAARLAEALGRRGVSVATPDGLMRISPGLASRPEEAGWLVDAVGEALREAR